MHWGPASLSTYGLAGAGKMVIKEQPYFYDTDVSLLLKMSVSL